MAANMLKKAGKRCHTPRQPHGLPRHGPGLSRTHAYILFLFQVNCHHLPNSSRHLLSIHPPCHFPRAHLPSLPPSSLPPVHPPSFPRVQLPTCPRCFHPSCPPSDFSSLPPVAPFLAPTCLNSPVLPSFPVSCSVPPVLAGCPRVERSGNHGSVIASGAVVPPIFIYRESPSCPQPS